ncbi:MAG: hypothetical protein C4522_02755 [Desulfobacteraceae bacterium]|nr:MAG: hypothetical protein C4522_02755 [Desulfobacteraceae bacterium]
MNQKTPKPIFGFRNFDCPFYDDCLSLAANNDWPQFTCEFCPNASQGQAGGCFQINNNSYHSTIENIYKLDEQTIEYCKYLRILNEIKKDAIDGKEKIDLELYYLLRGYFEYKTKYRHLVQKYFK